MAGHSEVGQTATWAADYGDLTARRIISETVGDYWGGIFPHGAIGRALK